MRVKVMAEIELDAENTEVGVGAVSDVLQEAFGMSPDTTFKAWLKPDDVDRDPRIDPKPGDRVKKASVKCGEIVREVRRVENGLIQYVVGQESKVCRLSTWLNWNRGAEIVKGEVSGDGKTEEGVGVPVVQVRERGGLSLDGESQVTSETR